MRIETNYSVEVLTNRSSKAFYLNWSIYSSTENQVPVYELDTYLVREGSTSDPMIFIPPEGWSTEVKQFNYDRIYLYSSNKEELGIIYLDSAEDYQAIDITFQINFYSSTSKLIVEFSELKSNSLDSQFKPEEIFGFNTEGNVLSSNLDIFNRNKGEYLSKELLFRDEKPYVLPFTFLSLASDINFIYSKDLGDRLSLFVITDDSRYLYIYSKDGENSYSDNDLLSTIAVTQNEDSTDIVSIENPEEYHPFEQSVDVILTQNSKNDFIITTDDQLNFFLATGIYINELEEEAEFKSDFINAIKLLSQNLYLNYYYKSTKSLYIYSHNSILLFSRKNVEKVLFDPDTEKVFIYSNDIYSELSRDSEEGMSEAVLNDERPIISIFGTNYRILDNNIILA